MTPGITITPLAELFAREGAHIYVPHAHDFYQIIWFREAGGTHMVDFSDYPISANSFFLIAPGQVHAFGRGCSTDGIVICATPAFLQGEPGAVNLFAKYRVHYDTVPYLTIADPDELSTLSDMIYALNQEITIHPDDLMHQVMLKLHANAFGILLCRASQARQSQPLTDLDQAPRLYVRFRRELAACYRELHSVKEYAERLHVSTKTLTKAVVECMDKTPGQCIDEQLTLQAKRLLSSTSLMVKEVADRLGFADVANFGKFFKKNTGLLPKQFREQSLFRH